MKTTAQVFGENVKEVAHAKKIKLGELEKAVGASVGYLSRNPNITLDRALQLCKILEMKLDDMVVDQYGKLLYAQTRMEELEQEIETIKSVQYLNAFEEGNNHEVH